MVAHLISRSINYVVAGNSKTLSSFRGPSGNNHEEGDTLIPYLLCLIPVVQNKAVVYPTDTDIFVLLMRFRPSLPCQQLFFQNTSDECIDIDIVHKFLGERIANDERANALLSLHEIAGCDTSGKFHGITGCDTSGKFNYKSKEHWVNLFLKYSNDLMGALFESQHSFQLCKVLEKFICRGYLREKDNAITLDKARWTLFKRLG